MTLEEMILDLEGRGWRIYECIWTGNMYAISLEQADREEDFYTDQETFKEAITEAWRICK